MDVIALVAFGVLVVAWAVLPLREMVFTKFPEERPKFASFKAKWDESFRKRWGIENTFAVEIPDGTKLPILRAYLHRWKLEVGVFFEGVGPDASDEQLRRIAPNHPVFRVEPMSQPTQ